MRSWTLSAKNSTDTSYTLISSQSNIMPAQYSNGYIDFPLSLTQSYTDFQLSISLGNNPVDYSVTYKSCSELALFE
jgi:hypothetical protein